MDTSEADDMPTRETREQMKRQAVEFVRRWNRKHRRAFHDHITDKSNEYPQHVRMVVDTSSTADLVAAYTAWMSNSTEVVADLHERLLEQYLVRTAHAVLHGKQSVAALIDDLVAVRPFPIVVAWKLHIHCVVDFNQILCRVICPGVPFRKRPHPSSSRHIEVSSSGLQQLTTALADTPLAAKSEYSAILRHVVSTYVDSTETPSGAPHHRPAAVPHVLRVAVDALVRHVCDVESILNASSKSSSSTTTLYLDLLQHIAADVAPHVAIQTLLKVQLLAHAKLAPSSSPCAASLQHDDFVRAFRTALTVSSFVSVVKDFFWTRPWHVNRFWTQLFASFQGDELKTLVLGAAHAFASHGILSLNATLLNTSASLAAHVASLPEYHAWFEVHFGSATASSAIGLADGPLDSAAAAPAMLCPHPASSCPLVTSKRTVQFVVTCFVERLPFEASRPHLDVSFKVLKQHSNAYPEFVLHYIQLARRKLNELAAAAKVDGGSSTNPTAKEHPEGLDVKEYISYFLDTGKVSGKIRQRILLQDSQWHSALKPGLLAARDLNSHVLSLGWMQLVHTLAREGAIGPAEYAPFVAKMHTILQTRVAARAVAASSAVHLAHEFAKQPDGAARSSDIPARLVRRLQSVQDLTQKGAEFVQSAAILAVQWPASRPVLDAMWTKGLASLDEQDQVLSRFQWMVQSEFEPSVAASRDSDHDITALARLLCVAGTTHANAVTSFLDKLVQPPIPPRNLERLLRLSVQVAACLHGDAPASSSMTNLALTVPLSVMSFLAWMQLRQAFGGPGTVSPDILAEHDVAALLRVRASSPHDALASWLCLELHQPTPLGDAASTYRFDCMASHFMQLDKSIQVAAITTVCSLGKELLRHQALCFKSPSPTALACPRGSTTASRLANGQLLHPVWLRSPQLDDTPPRPCHLESGMTLFHQVVPLLFANKGDMQPANLHTALVNTFVDAAHTLLLDRPSDATTARVGLTLVDLVDAVFAHSHILVPSSGNYTSPPKLQATVRGFIATHLQAIAPWPVRVVSTLHLLLPAVDGALHSTAAASDAPPSRDATLFASLVVTAAHQPRPLPPLYTHLHAALCTSQADPRLYTVVPLQTGGAIDVILNVLRHCVAWMSPDTAPRAVHVLAHLHGPSNTLTLLDRIVHMYFASCSSDDASTSPTVVPAAFLTMLLEMTRQLLSNDVQRCGQLILQCATETSTTTSAMWFLLLVAQCDDAAVDECLRLHGTPWLERTCGAFLAYLRTPPDRIPIPAAVHTRLPAVLGHVLECSRRHAVPFATADYLMALRPVVSPELQTNLEAITILEDDDAFFNGPTPPYS